MPTNEEWRQQRVNYKFGSGVENTLHYMLLFIQITEVDIQRLSPNGVILFCYCGSNGREETGVSSRVKSISFPTFYVINRCYYKEYTLY